MSSGATLYARESGLEAIEMDGDLVMMGLDQGEYYALRGVAASLWSHLDEPRTVEDLSALVAREFDVTPERCRDDVAAFLDDLLERRLVTTRRTP